MYDHEYEWDILGFLRMLKYVWQRDKDILADLVRDYRCVEIDTEDIFELSVALLTEYICVDMPDDGSDDSYGDEFTRFILSEPELDEYLDLIAKLEENHFNTTRCTGWNKLRDAVEMFVGNVLFENCAVQQWRRLRDLSLAATGVVCPHRVRQLHHRPDDLHQRGD